MNEVLKIEKSTDTQLVGHLNLPSQRMERTGTDSIYIRLYQKTFVIRVYADWSKSTTKGMATHVHLLLTMRPFNPDHSWERKKSRIGIFVRDKSGNIVIDESTGLVAG
ncbi:MAG: MobA/MobL family protein [Blautia faecis]